MISFNHSILLSSIASGAMGHFYDTSSFLRRTCLSQGTVLINFLTIINIHDGLEEYIDRQENTKEPSQTLVKAGITAAALGTTILVYGAYLSQSGITLLSDSENTSSYYYGASQILSSIAITKMGIELIHKGVASLSRASPSPIKDI